MKLYIFAFAAFVAAAGSASANIDYIDCDFAKYRSYSDAEQARYCGDRSRDGDERNFVERQNNGGSNYNNYGSSNAY